MIKSNLKKRINKRFLVLTISLLYFNTSFTKETSIVLGTSLNLPPPGSLRIEHPEIKKNPLLLGAGIYVNIYTKIKKSKVSSIVYGAEISKIRFLFMNSSSFLVPIYYCFKFPINRDFNFRFNMGSNILIQPYTETIGLSKLNNSLSIKRDLTSGIYLLLHLEIGFDYETKNKRKFLFSAGFNKGIAENETLTFSTGSYESITKLNNSYIELKLGYKFRDLK